MSEVKVNSIKGVGANVAAISIDNADGTCTANITNNLSNRNLVINGAMNVAQRGTSSTSSGYYSIDRFATGSGNIGQNVTQSQESLSSSDAPYALGFRKYKRVQLAAAGNANANAFVESAIYVPEAQDLASSGWNYTSSSSNITLSFWFRCSTNQAFLLNLRTEDGSSRMFSTTFTASANNTWTKITKTFSGNSNISIDSDNGAGLKIFWSAFYGTDYTDSGSTMDAWKAYSGSSQGTDMASTWLTAGASTFDITGVQLEVSDHATDFEHRSFADELQRCLRYFHQWKASDASSTAYMNLASGYGSGTTFAEAIYPLPVTMRAAPSFSTSGNWRFVIPGNAMAGSNLILNRSHPKTAYLRGSVNGGTFANHNGLSGEFGANNDTSFQISFSAEL